jgi:uncharacterized protein (TIGR00369 family)
MGAEDTAARWIAEEGEVRAHTPEAVGIPKADDVRGLSGLEMLSAMIAGKLPRAPISRTLDFLLVHVEAGVAVFQGHPSLDHYNPLGSVHGGWYATLLDSAMGCAVQSTLPAGKAYTTMEFRVNLVRPLTAGVPVVRAEGRIVHPGRQVAMAEARLVGPDGKLYAHGTTTCLVFDRK